MISIDFVSPVLNVTTSSDTANPLPSVANVLRGIAIVMNAMDSMAITLRHFCPRNRWSVLLSS